MSSALRFPLLAMLLSAAVIVGCKKQAPTPSATVAVSTNQDAGESAAPAPTSGRFPTPAPAVNVVVEDTGDVNATLNQLSLELRKYVVRTRSIPRTFEEFVAKSHAQVPPAPPGKKYAIEGQAVVLKKA